MRILAMTLGICLMALPAQAHQSVYFGGDRDVPYWEDMRIPGLVTTRNVDAPDIVSFGASGNLVCLGFAGTGPTTEQVYYAAQTPHSMKLGTDLDPHVHWTPTTADAGDVVWTIEYDYVRVDGTFAGSTTITCTTDSTNSTAWDHLIATCSDIETSVDDDVSAMIMGRLARDPTDANDTYAADACLLELDFHYEVDTHGSVAQYSKYGGSNVIPVGVAVENTPALCRDSIDNDGDGDTDCDDADCIAISGICGFLLLEGGDYLLLEIGDKIILE